MTLCKAQSIGMVQNHIFRNPNYATYISSHICFYSHGQPKPASFIVAERLVYGAGHLDATTYAQWPIWQAKFL